MKINQIIVEAEQLDELGLADVGRGIGSVAGKTAQGLGAVAGGVKGAWDAAKSGYQSGKSKTEAIAYLGCSEDFLRSLREKAELSFSKFGSMIWYELRSIDRFLERNKVV